MENLDLPTAIFYLPHPAKKNDTYMENGYAMNRKKSARDLWKPLPGNSGEYFSVHGHCIAGAQSNRLTVWCNEDKVFEGYAPVSCDGYPLWKADSVFWNDSRIDLRERQLVPLGNLKENILGVPESDAHPATPNGKRPVSFAWSPDAEYFLYTAEDSSDTPDPKAQAFFSEKDGSGEKLLWEGYDPVPHSACIGENWMVLGTRNPMVFDREGKLLQTLPGGMLPKRIHLSNDGTVLSIQTHESVTLWHTDSWQVKAVIKGPWLNAAMSPGGGTLYAIDFEGYLYTGDLLDERSELRKIPVPAPLTTIDAGEEWLVAGFAKGNAVRRASRKAIDVFLTGSEEEII
jgi:hypothetical protein